MLPCLNCKKDVNPDSAVMFAEVFLCAECGAIAERLYKRTKQELKTMLMALKGTICTAALKGELRFSGADRASVKESLVSHLDKLVKESKKEKDLCLTQTTSKEDTLPSALIVGGKQR